MTKEEISNADLESIINAFTNEISPDIDWYIVMLDAAGITLNMLRYMAQNRSFCISRMESGALEISFRKGDHTAVTIVTAEGKIRTMMKDYLDY